MMGEIIDYDETKSGQRREALYNGLSGFAWKASMGGSIFIATQSMSAWGNSLENPAGVLMVGPIAGIFGVMGLIAILFYPVLHVTREQPPA
jgi:Na+/melibiose symporter-like transporter